MNATTRQAPRTPRTLWAALALVALAAGVCAWMPSASPRLPASVGATPAAPRLLKAGGETLRSIRVGEIESYRVRLAAGDLIHAVVEQEGAHVAVSLKGPAGESLVTVEDPESTRGVLEALAVAPAAGEIRLDVRGLAGAGRYRLRLEPLRPGGPRDRLRAEAAYAITAGDDRRGEDLDGAIACYLRAIGLAAQAGDPRLRARAFYHLGRARERQSRYLQALATYQEILSAPEAGPPPVDLLNAEGRCYFKLEEPQEARELLAGVAARAEREGDRLGHGVALDILGLVASSRGDFQASLELLRRARDEFHELGALSEEGFALANLGETHLALGNFEEAADACERALSIQERIGDREGALVSLRDLGSVELGARRLASAEASFTAAIARAIAQGDRRIEVGARNGLAFVHFLSGDFDRSAADSETARRLARAAGDRFDEGNALGNLGAALGRKGDLKRSLAAFAQAEALYAGEPAARAEVLFGRADALERAGRLDEARATIERSIALVEELRTRPAASNLRASFFAARQSHYELFVRVLMKLDAKRPRQGYDALAFEASEKTRARTLLEELAADRLDVRGEAPPELQAREDSTRRRLGLVEREKRDLVEHATRRATARLPELDAEIRGLDTTLEQVRGEMRAHSSRYRALADPRPLTLREIQREVLDRGSLLLVYFLGEQESYLWCIDQASLRAYRLPPRARIEDQAKWAYEALRAGDDASGAADAARRTADLSATVLAPAAAQLGRRRLLIVADGRLETIPFEVLPEPVAPGREKGRPPALIVEAHVVVKLPSASVARSLRKMAKDRPAPPKLWAGLGDAVFEPGDARVAGAGRRALPGVAAEPGGGDLERSVRDVGLDRLPRLPYTRREIESILALVPPGRGLEAVDFAASRELAVSPELGLFRYLHFATHGILDALHPELSGLVLSMVDAQGRRRDGYLHAYEVYGLHLRADLVVLSACRTALGREVRGEGLMGLTRGFMYAGAPRVVVTLWSINDRATSFLMERFYVGVLQRHLAPAAALREAQLETRKRWPSPYYWAAFELQGDWQ